MKSAFPPALGIAIALVSLATPSFAAATVQSLAGFPDAKGFADGATTAARFSDPAGLAVDSFGNVFIADSANHLIRKLSAKGVVSTVAGKPGAAGFNDGASSDAHFDTPSALAVAKDGTLFISDTGNHTIRRRTIDGQITTLAGFAGSFGPTNGLGSIARFNGPLGITFAPNGDLVVADSGNHAIRRITQAGKVTTLSGTPEQWGAIDGKGDQVRFNGPVAVAFNRSGNLYVSDSFNHAIRQITPDGTVTTFAGKLGEDGFVDGPRDAARLGAPAEMAFDSDGNLFVADAFYNTVHKISPDSTVSTVAGLAGQYGTDNGVGAVARFLNPYGLVLLPDASIVLSDTYNQTIRQLTTPFTLTAIRSPQGATVIRWESIPGRTYQVLVRSALSNPWQPLGSNQVASATTAQYTDSVTDSQRFYQILRLN